MITPEQRDLREALIDEADAITIACDWVRTESARQRAGAPRVVWTGDFELPSIGDEVAVWPGCCWGIVADYGMRSIRGQFERAVWVLIYAGTVDEHVIKVTGRECMPVTKQDRERIDAQDEEFRSRLVAAGRKVERQRKERRQRQVLGSHLLDEMMDVARSLTVDELSSFYRISGTAEDKAVYLAKRGGRVDLSGFVIPHEAVTEMSEIEAQKRHLGRIRGQIDFKKGDDRAMDAYRRALSLLTA